MRYNRTQNSSVLRGTVLALSLCGLTMLLAISSGCNRSHYRKKADQEAYCLVNTVAHDPRWELKDYTINADKESRFYDPYNPDCEPMPEDDATAHRLMQRVDGMKGSKAWKKYGRTPYTENPLWKQYLSLDENGAIVLDKETAVKLALKHSPNYQTALEELYKSALAVSTQRYEFDTKFFGGASLFYTVDGTPTTTLQEKNEFGLSKKFATGADLLIDFANTMTWQFHGNNTSNSMSVINMSFMQPLLRGAGRAIVLENLTQAERDLLADVRDMAYFQQGFYVATVAGSSAISGPGGAGAGFNTGYYSLLSEQVRINNQMGNIASLENTLNRTTQMFLAGRSATSKVDVNSTRISLLTSQQDLLTQRGNYDSRVEGFLQSLGLPPDQKVRVQDPLLEQFELMSPSLTKQQDEVNSFLAILRDVNQPVFEEMQRRLPEFSQRLLLETQVVEKDLQYLEKMVPERISNLKILADRPALKNGEVLEDVCSIAEFQTRGEELRRTLPEIKERIELLVELNKYIAEMDRETVLDHLEHESFDAKILEMLYQLKILDLIPILSSDIQDRVEKAYREQLERLVRQRRLPQMEITRIDGILPTLERAAEGHSLVKQAYEDLLKKREDYQSDLEHILVQIEEIETVKEEETLKRIRSWVAGDRNLASGRTFEQARENLLLDRSPSALMRAHDPYRNWLNRIVYRISVELNDLLILQAKVRLDSIVLTPIETTAEEAFETAAENRLDWMNRRAALVDTWRQIEIKSNALKSALDIQVDGSIGTRGNNPVNFSSKEGTLTVGVKWDTPLDRLREQNAYRTALIDYQRARRDYYTYVDNVKKATRDAVRDIQVSQLGFEILRERVYSAILNVDVAVLRLDDPDPQNANATRDVLDSLTSLLSAQNSFMSTWVDYLEKRMQFELIMGTFKLDDRGMWIDKGAEEFQKRQSGEVGERLDAPVPDTVPDALLVPTLPNRNDQTQPQGTNVPALPAPLPQHRLVQQEFSQPAPPYANRTRIAAP